jgi:hypothetical protein
MSLASAAALLVMAGGCAGDQTTRLPSAAYPQGLRAELQTLRDPNGLFIYPGYYRQAGSLYSTALLGAALGGWTLTHQQATAATAALCHGQEPKLVHPTWLAWAATETLGENAFHSSAGACLSRTPPAPTGDPTQDIPLLWAWARTVASLGMPRAKISSVAAPRLAHLPVDSVISPYVRWRLDQLDVLTGAADTAVAHPAAPPSHLVDPTDLLDLWGYAERCVAHQELCDSSGAPNVKAVLEGERYFGDDLSLAAAIAIARIQGKTALVATLRQSIAQRVDPETGLVRSGRPEGDIASTFLVLQMAPDLFPGPAPAATARVMQDDLELGSRLDTATRLRAVAVLKASGGPAWTAYKAEISTAVRWLTSTPTTRSSLQSRVDVIEALRLLDPNVPLVTLTTFPTADAEAQQLARLALAHADVFANAAAVRIAFASVRERLLAEAVTPKDPLIAFFSAANAISGAELQPDPALHQRLVVGMSRTQGCYLNGRAYRYLFRSSMAAGESCSLEATWQAIRSGFAYGDP